MDKAKMNIFKFRSTKSALLMCAVFPLASCQSTEEAKRTALASAIEAQERLNIVYADFNHYVAARKSECFIRKSTSKVRFEVYADGSSEMILKTEYGIYPGTTVYFAVGAERSSWPSGSAFKIRPAIVKRLAAGERFDVNWTRWPYGTMGSFSDDFKDFGAAYEQCILRLREASPHRS